MSISTVLRLGPRGLDGLMIWSSIALAMCLCIERENGRVSQIASEQGECV